MDITPELYINNATPAVFNVGTNDLSTRTVDPTPLARPEFMPFIASYAERGDTTPVVVDGNSYAKLFGDKTLDPNSKFFNHAALYLKGVLEDAGTVVFKRIVPESATTPASLRVSLEYVEVPVPEYARDTSGQFKRDQVGKLIQTGRTVPGIMYKFVITQVPVTEMAIGGQVVKNFEFGAGAESVGELLVDGQISKRVPLFDFAVSSAGSWGNLTGVSIWAPVKGDQSGINAPLMKESGAYPFRITVRYRRDEFTNVNVTETTVNAEREFDFTLKPGSKTKTGVLYYLGDNFVEKYNAPQGLDPNIPPSVGRFNRLHVYQQNIDQLLEKFMVIETNAEQIGDFTGVTAKTRSQDKQYLFNIFGGKHSDGKPYQTFRQGVLGNQGTMMIESVTHFAKGGEDGPMSDELFAKEIEALMEQFADENNRLMDTVTYNDSVFIDTGLPLDTKLTLGKYISTRHDRWLVASTHVHGETYVSPVEANARAAMLRSAYRNYPDSVLFGTSTFRAVIVKGSAKLIPSVLRYPYRISTSYELIRKLTKFWGAKSGIANRTYDLTEGNNQYFDYCTDISDPWVPYAVRSEAWSSGAMWAELSEQKTPYFPTYRTVYDDDTSTLMNVRIMMTHVALTKIGNDIQKRFSGKDWSQERFTEEILAYFYSRVADNKFGGKVKVSGHVTFTEADNRRGFSWKFNSRLYGDNFRTVMLGWTENYRSSDLPEDFTGVTA